VVGLRHARILTGQCREYLDRLCILFLLRGDHTPQKAHLHIVRVLLEITIRLFGSLVSLSLVEQLAYFIRHARSERGQVAKGNAAAHKYGEHDAGETRRVWREV